MRVVTKTGDIFSVKINENSKKYMQYIANDLTQLNSDVIRAFKKVYLFDENPSLEDIVKDDVDFYAHCVLKFGVKMNLWEKVGKSKNIGNVQSIIFRDTNDYGHKMGDEPIKTSHNWYIWHINDKNFTQKGKLTKDNQNACVGLVFNPLGIIELMKGNKYPINYPDYE